MTSHSTPAARHYGFTLIEVLVVITIIAVLLGFLLPSLEKAREKANNLSCAANLSQIGVGLLIYANENQGQYPRTIYDAATADNPVAGTNPTAADPFRTGGPQANDTSAPLFLLLRAERLPSKIFIDPYTDELEGVADPVSDPTSHSNFTDYKKNLAYSYANPYPNQTAATAGYKLTSKMKSTLAVAADLNPGTGVGKNSRNHEGRGQNVLFADTHVEWEKTSKCGNDGDDIYTNKAGLIHASPTDATDSLLLPTDN